MEENYDVSAAIQAEQAENFFLKRVGSTLRQ